MKDIYDQLEVPEKEREIAVSRREGEYLYELVKEYGFTKTLETGLAFGFSAAYIISASQSLHVAIDPHAKDRQNKGLSFKNLRKLGLDNFLEHKAELSHVALPKLLSEGRKFDFIFIDADHKFDGVFLDWYYADLLLERNGLIVFDDTWMRSIQTLAAFIRANRVDYREDKSREKNFYIFEKVGTDKRNWDHFEEFQLSAITS